MKRVLVTGCAGFIGSHTCEALIKNNYKVVGIDNFNNYYSPKLKENNIKELLENDNFRLVRGDFTDPITASILFENFAIDSVIHLGARAGVRPSFEYPHLYIQTNINGTLNILESGIRKGVKKYLLASSSSVYGINDEVPFAEHHNVQNQISPYAATKAGMEHLARAYQNAHDLDISCFRFFTVYGERGRPDMAIAKFTKMIDNDQEIPVYGSLDSSRDYTYVEDIVNGLIAALEKDFTFEVFNLGNDNPIKLGYLISLIEENLGKKAKMKHHPLQKGDVPRTWAGIEKSKSFLNYSPSTPIEQGIRKYVSWYNENRELLNNQ